MKRYLKVWWQLTHVSFARELATRFSSLLFFSGKILRFGFFLLFLFSLVNRTGGIAGYSKEQIVIFFLVFNIIDITAQFFMRGIYLFRPLVVSGEFDHYLAKPISPLFHILSGHADLMDLFTLIMLIGYFWWFLSVAPIAISVTGILLFMVMVTGGLIIALAFHIIVAGIGVITTEVDHTIWIYRDLSQMARIPVDVYAQPVRVALTYFFPVALMLTFPAKALFGLLSPPTIIVSLGLSLGFLWLSFRFWHFALSQYSSASS